MTLPIISIFALVAALAIGWKVGQIAQTTATEQLHLPVNRLGNVLPLAAALALAGGLTLGAWQASEDYFRPSAELALEACSSAPPCSPCGTCPSSE